MYNSPGFSGSESTCSARQPRLIPWKIPWRKDRPPTPVFLGFPGGSDGEESACKAGDLDSIRGLGRSAQGGHGHPLQCSHLENPHGQRSLAGYSPWRHRESDLTEQCIIAHQAVMPRSFYIIKWVAYNPVKARCEIICIFLLLPMDMACLGFP